MSDGRAWEGNWKARLYARALERGYDSLTAFVEARPTASLEQRKQVTRFVRDVST